MRLRVTVPQPKPLMAVWDGGEHRPAPIDARQLFFAEADRHLPASVYERDALAAGSIVQGPSVIQEADTATIVHPGQHVQVDSFGNLLIETGGAS